MFPFANEMPITLEALDANGGVLSDMEASLRHLDGERAIVALSSHTPAPCLHWGTRVRFQIVDGRQNYDIIGMVIAHDLPASRRAPDDSESQDPIACEATLHLWECRASDQRRGSPRRHTCFDVQFRSVDDKNGDAETEARAASLWEQGTCVDIGGGGLCLCIPHGATLPKRMELRFTLPSHDPEIAVGQKFTLCGRVLRTTDHADRLEIALRFEHLSVAEGMALAAYLA